MKRLGQVLSKFLIQWYYGPDHPAKVRLWEQIWSLLGKPRLTIPYQEEARISVDIHDWVQKKIVEEGVYEPEVWEALAAHANENEVVWDIGGHVGGVAIRAALHPGVGAVHTFEPHPETYDALTTNIRLNPDLPIAAYNIALGNRRGYQKLEEGPSINSGQSSLGNTFGNRTFDVRCSTIDHLVSHEKVSAPTLMKIDVEGWEAKVLTGAEWLLGNHPPRAIAFEDEALSTNEEVPRTNTVLILEAAGYTITRIPRGKNQDHDVDNYLAFQST